MGGGTHDGTGNDKPWNDISKKQYAQLKDPNFYPNRNNRPREHFYEPCKTLRDEFAMAALMGRTMPIEDECEFAKWAYVMADAMMKERVK